MEVKLRELVVKRRGGKKEVDFVEFFIGMLEALGSREQIRDMIDVMDKYDDVWLKTRLNIFNEDEDESEKWKKT